jgi:hypothetical protein
MKNEDAIVELYILYAECLAKAKQVESAELTQQEYNAIETLSLFDDPEERTSFSENIKSSDTSFAYGQLEGIRMSIERLERKKFKFPNPSVRMNGHRLIAINSINRTALYRGFIAGEPTYYVLKPGAKALEIVADPRLDSVSWCFLNPDMRR